MDPDDSTGPPGERTQPLRRDAARNRERILSAACTVFAREGLSASMASVAREAGVGIATLFRRFPTQGDLIDAVFAERMNAYSQLAEKALADPDPWHGFTTYVESVCAMQAADRGFADVLTMTFPQAKGVEQARMSAYRGYVTLTQRAKATGRLRPDFAHQDLVILLTANAGVIAATHQTAPDAWRRLVAYMMQAFENPDGERPGNRLPKPPSVKALDQAMYRNAPGADRH
ncbi:TetR/AcrR family transcriptional regulator [Streptomyces sp. NRRL F-5123]|uniref:TetR/AcrR family transcriptional regulator n=1 Tax=Streptomyces sp. NRRL F-5123 TaxID=1463856 RepID=UPI0005BD0FE4|nr:TetR/AcrR family transcriptional regulator [Streptomyces sp. NRRL F-5123]